MNSCFCSTNQGSQVVLSAAFEDNSRPRSKELGLLRGAKDFLFYSRAQVITFNGFIDCGLAS